MANLKIIRTRIESVASTRQITSAMKMVSAAKLRKAQDAIVNLRPYAQKLQLILEAITNNLQDDEDFIFAKESEVINKVLIIVITSNRGLCGAFNTNVIKQAILIANEKYSSQLAKNNVDFFTIGKKGDDYLKKKNYKIVKSGNELYEALNFENTAAVAKAVMEQFKSKEYDRVEIVYNQFKNAAVQILTAEQFLPVKVVKVKKEEEEHMYKTFIDYIYEPSKAYIINELIPRSLKLKFYKALIDSYASEHGARMTAMHKATDNATEMIKQLRLDYNKARQASITNEILEIVSGANALRG